MATIQDGMPVILAPAAYMRWLGPEQDPRDLDEALSVRSDEDVADRQQGRFTAQQHARYHR
ncbi:SOS response-associated peptidase [Mesorhizobium sp. B2-5-9]|uniref:SOS response-associated peptidase n=1 Tax=Mesorhizobium sp. B2-5-9 TaxID=2589921 RepID=UPI001FED62DF|nr:SOS response-associated peptidase [Mesorhizobium sp. B2-5-9]